MAQAAIERRLTSAEVIGFPHGRRASEMLASLMTPFSALGYTAHEQWAWDNYKSVILAFAAEARLPGGGAAVRLLEIGGGRDPLFTPAEARAAGLHCTVNDIDAGELALAPKAFDRALFDIAGDLSQAQARTGSYDLIVSQMVFEHIRDVRMAWSNIYDLLTPGGVALAFFPTLYAPPYMLNRLMPEALSSALLKLFFPRRNDKMQPKFPAFYDHCFGSQKKAAPMFEAIGFREHLIVPFWSHGYFRHLPVLRELDAAVQALARRRDWRALTTYAYAVVRK